MPWTRPAQPSTLSLGLAGAAPPSLSKGLLCNGSGPRLLKKQQMLTSKTPEQHLYQQYLIPGCQIAGTQSDVDVTHVMHKH